MLQTIRTLTFLCVFAGLGAGSVRAQSMPRGFISIGGGYQSTTTTFDDSFTFTRDQETGTTRVTYPVDAGPVFDVGGGVRLWRGLGVGVAVSRFSRDGAITASSSVPHPLFFQQHREVTGDADGITREETGVHVQAQFTVPVTRSVHLTLMGGPSFLEVNHQLVLDVNYTETYPYDTAEFAGVDTSSGKRSQAGFNVGADVRWMFTERLGVGGLVRFTRATVDLEAADSRTVSVDAGGLQAGVGVRIGF